MTYSLRPHELQHARLQVLHYLLELVQIYVHWVSDAILPSHLLLPSSPALNLSQDQYLFLWISSSHQAAKCWGFSFNISSSSEYSGLISFRINWFDLLAVQQTLKSFLQQQFKSSNFLASSVFFMFHLSQWILEKPYHWLYGYLSVKWCLCI